MLKKCLKKYSNQSIKLYLIGLLFIPIILAIIASINASQESKTAIIPKEAVRDVCILNQNKPAELQRIGCTRSVEMPYLCSKTKGLGEGNYYIFCSPSEYFFSMEFVLSFTVILLIFSFYYIGAGIILVPIFILFYCFKNSSPNTH
ncbi:hypothetical protein GF376_03980 [Candidatus Peregrinibacteria bacterium]|nr:hypothetical protein [Candidatus Peregrinibacteria bacterium]